MVLQCAVRPADGAFPLAKVCESLCSILLARKAAAAPRGVVPQVGAVGAPQCCPTLLQPRTPRGALCGDTTLGHPTCAVTEPPSSPPSPHADRSTAGLRVPPRPTGAGDGGGCGPWAWGVGHRCAASPLRGNGLLISTQIGVLSGDYHRALPGYRSAPTFAPRLRAPTLPCVRRAERGGAVPNLFASPPHSSCKKKQQKKPNPQLLQTLFLSPSWNQCGIFVAGIWRGRSRAGMWRRH